MANARVIFYPDRTIGHARKVRRLCATTIRAGQRRRAAALRWLVSDSGQVRQRRRGGATCRRGVHANSICQQATPRTRAEVCVTSYVCTRTVRTYVVRYLMTLTIIVAQRCFADKEFATHLSKQKAHSSDRTSDRRLCTATSCCKDRHISPLDAASSSGWVKELRPFIACAILVSAKFLFSLADLRKQRASKHTTTQWRLDSQHHVLSRIREQWHRRLFLFRPLVAGRFSQHASTTQLARLFSLWSSIPSPSQFHARHCLSPATILAGLLSTATTAATASASTGRRWPGL